MFIICYRLVLPILYGPLIGVYAVLLTVEDNAGNAQVARRFLIFDNNSTISTYTDDNKQLRVTSAAKNTSYSWLTSLQDPSNAGENVRF